MSHSNRADYSIYVAEKPSPSQPVVEELDGSLISPTRKRNRKHIRRRRKRALTPLERVAQCAASGGFSDWPACDGETLDIGYCNHCSPRQLLKVPGFRNSAYGRLVQMAVTKVHDNPKNFPRRDAIQNLTGILTALSQGDATEELVRLAECGPVNNSGLPSTCHRAALCPSCNHWQIKNEIKRLASCFTQNVGQVHFLTLSLSQPVEIGWSGEALNVVWDTYAALLDEAVATGLIQGVVGVKSVEGVSYLPLRARPHVHAVVLAQDGPGLVEALLRMLVHSPAWRTLKKLFRGVEPDFDCRTPASAGGLKRVLRYSMRTLSPAQEYLDAYEACAKSERPLLNEEFRRFVHSVVYNFKAEARSGQDWHGVLYKSKSRVFRKGDMHWSATDSRCTPKVEWFNPQNLKLQTAIDLEAQKLDDEDWNRKGEGGGVADPSLPPDPFAEDIEYLRRTRRKRRP